MATTTIIQLTSSNPTAVQDAVKALESASLTGRITFGTHIQEPNTLQITVEDTMDGHSSTQAQDLLTPILGAPTTKSTLPYPILSPASRAPASFPVVEYVQSFFPVSKLTPQFEKQIEADFDKFFSLVQPGGAETDPGKIVTGWSDEVEHPDIEGAKARAWTVARGWETMGAFEALVGTEEFKNAIPILYGWGAPYRMWHIETKFQSGRE